MVCVLLRKVIATQVDMEGALWASTSVLPLVFGSCKSGSYTERQVEKTHLASLKLPGAFNSVTVHNC